MTTTVRTTDNGKAPAPIQLRNAHDFGIVVRALEDRGEEVDKLAKKNEEEGYVREARTQRADAAAIRQFILPTLRGQTELPLVTAEQVRAGIVARIRPLLHNALVVLAPKEKQEDALVSRETTLAERIALYVEAYVSAVAEEAYNAGRQARESDPEAIALRMLSALDA